MSRNKHYNILLVDDEFFVRESLKRIINSLDSDFIVAAEATNAQEALDMLDDRLNFQLVITDIRMPIMDGLELSKKIHEKYPDIPIIILTGYSEFEYAQQAIRNGVTDYLLKPVEDDELEDVLNNVSLMLQNEYSLSDDDSSFEGMDVMKLINRATKYMQEHFNEDIDIGGLADRLGFQSPHFTKLFTKYAGKPPLKYLTDIRIRASMRLLQETSLSIHAVGMKVGYPDQFHFSKTFRKITGKNPTEYRREMQQYPARENPASDNIIENIIDQEG